MSSCTECGHQLGVGRFCTNCGAPVAELDWRTDTAERKLGEPVPASDPRTPPAVVAPPPPPRYPLFADELDSWTSSGSTVAAADPAGAVDAAEPPLPEEYVDPAPYLGQHDDHDSHEFYYE